MANLEPEMIVVAVAGPTVVARERSGGNRHVVLCPCGWAVPIWGTHRQARRHGRAHARRTHKMRDLK